MTRPEAEEIVKALHAITADDLMPFPHFLAFLEKAFGGIAPKAHASEARSKIALPGKS
jgi:hypothetical protein